MNLVKPNMLDSNGAERREARRLPIELPATVNLKLKWKRVQMRLTACRPSQFGLALQTPISLPVGTGVKLVVHTENAGGEEACHLWGRVVWSRQKNAQQVWQAGIRLTRWRSRDLRAWQNFILKKLRSMENR